MTDPHPAAAMAIQARDDIPRLKPMRPIERPTVTRHNPERQGDGAAKLLLERLTKHESHEGRYESLPFDVVVRQTA